jgi:hypothetical protein
MEEQLSLFEDKIGKISLTSEQRNKLKKLYSQRYRYVTSQPEITLYPLSFWSLKPSRTSIIESDGERYYYWGYQDKDLQKDELLMSCPAYKFDIEELHGKTTREPMLLVDLL